jgi:predicted DNA-binding transcriptional regulator AlpA
MVGFEYYKLAFKGANMSRSFASLVSAAELRSSLSLSESTLRRWISQRRIPAPITIGKKMYWHEDALQKALASVKLDGPPASPSQAADRPKVKHEKGGEVQ